MIASLQEKIEELENLLRIETISSEEQRVYISMLKESITDRLDQESLTNIL